MFRGNRDQVNAALVAAVGVMVIAVGAVGALSGGVHFVLGHDRPASVVIAVLGCLIAIRGVSLHRRATRDREGAAEFPVD